MNKEELALQIDFTLLQAFATYDDIKKLCIQAVRYGFYSVCVNPVYVRFASCELSDSRVKVCTVAGFPFGGNKKDVKAFEAKNAVKDGAAEVDMVINIGALKSGDRKTVKEDIACVVKAASPHPVKVIIETCYLNDSEKIDACRLAADSGAAFVKTSTGFGTSGASVADVRLLKSIAGNSLKIKAAGGIRSLADALALIEAGADRIGTSRGVQIISELV